MNEVRILKKAIEDKTFEKIKQLLKEANTLSVEEIQAKLKDKGINVSASVVRRAFKSRKYKYRNKKTNVETMLLNSNQKRARKCFWEKYINLDYSKIIFTDEWVFKYLNIETESGELRMNLIKIQH